MTDSSNDDISEALAAVGPRLRALRVKRDVTLQSLSESTGISVSTLSRLESAQAHQVPLDELVGAPTTGDPRVHLRPIDMGRGTVVPLTRRPGGIQAYKHVLHADMPLEEPDLKVHEGYEWLYVLNGNLRMVLGELDLVLPAGEAVEFDTRVPHWFGKADRSAVEFLSLFGRQGERMHLRAKTT